jgi:hypothetical protein
MNLETFNMKILTLHIVFKKVYLKKPLKWGCGILS